MKSNIKDHYKNLFNKYGYSSKAVQYPDKKTHYKRFEVLIGIDNELDSLIDVGCGLGHFLHYLIKKNMNVKYLGLDFVEEFIDFAQKRFINYKSAQFKVFDVEKEKIPSGYDYVFLNGVFNNKRQYNKRFMEHTLEKMFHTAKSGISFNALSTYVDYKDKDLYYTDPCKIFNFCKKNLTKKIILRHDYLIRKNVIPFEYTIYLYK